MSEHRRHMLSAPSLAAVVVSCILTACGSDGSASSSADVGPSTDVVTDPVDDTLQGPSGSGLSGIVRDPPPVVDTTSIPSLSEPGTDVEFRARPGALKVVYFGFTNCPDVCPTTLADLTVALRKLPADLAADVDTVMVTIDPDRDLDLLTGYVQSFIPDAAAAGTTDTERLASASEAFGASFDVRSLADGTVEVDHSPFLYVVDDEGRLVLTWQFGAPSDDIAADLELLLTTEGAP